MLDLSVGCFHRIDILEPRSHDAANASLFQLSVMSSCALQLVHRGRLLTPLLDRKEVRHRLATAAEIKKNVPELWVRKMKTFFAFADVTGEGLANSEDYKMYEKLLADSAATMNVSKDRIEVFKKTLSELWMERVGGGEFQWTENGFSRDHV